MKKKKYIPKYQYGPQQDGPFGAQGNPNDYTQNYNLGTSEDNNPPDAGQTYNPLGGPHFSFKDWMNIGTGLAVGTTFLANSINSARDYRQERGKYYHELYGHPVDNNYTQNDNPIYTKYGGLPAYPYGGGPLTAEGAKEILRDGTIHGKPLTDKQKRYFGYIAGGGTPKSEYGEDVGLNNYEMQTGGKWIPNNLHKGRCKNPGSPECPKGSPQYNLAMTFKKHHGFHKAEYGDDIPETYGDSSRQDARIEAEGGEVYQQPDGGIVKIADNAPSHEQGGVPLGYVDKVLEDTSTSRTDPMSKNLRITPTMFKSMFGIDAARTMSHSEALEAVDKHYQKQANKYGGKINKSLETLNEYPDDVFANNSFELNTRLAHSMPTRNDAFNYLFHHQETTKAQYGMQNGDKADIGWADGDIGDPYSGGNTSQRTKYNYDNLDIAGLTRLWNRIAGIDPSKMSNTEFQSASYDWVLKNDPDRLRSMWSKYGNTNQGKRLGIGKNYDFNNLTDTQLQNLKQAYTDGLLGARTLTPHANTDIEPVHQTPSYTTPTPTGTVSPLVTGQPTAPVADNSVGTPTQTPQAQHASNFYEPLRWYDLAGPFMNLADSGRIPAKYNPARFNEVRLKFQNPNPALAAGQQQYNDATRYLPTDSQSVLPKLFAAKYAQDNQILGQYENANAGTKNQEVMYNANVRDRQSQSDQQSRAVFEQQMLGSLEAERQQKLTAFDDLFTRIALNRKLNREGNLIQQMFPHYNSFGEYNGNQAQFYAGVNNDLGNSTGQVVFKTVYDEYGNPHQIAVDSTTGKQISKSKFIPLNTNTSGR